MFIEHDVRNLHQVETCFSDGNPNCMILCPVENWEVAQCILTFKVPKSAGKAQIVCDVESSRWDYDSKSSKCTYWGQKRSTLHENSAI